MKPGSKNIATKGNFNKKTDSLITEFKKATQGKSIPTRKDSIVSAYHHNHMFHKNKHYMNDPYYDKSKKDAKEVAKKFPKLDAHMKVKENRAKLGYDYK